MVKTCKCVCSTKSKSSLYTAQAWAIDSDPLLQWLQTNEMHIWEESIIKLYTDDCWRFQISSWSGNQYTIIVYHLDTNTILKSAFKTHSNKQLIKAQNFIVERLAKNVHNVKFQLLDNGASAAYKNVIEDTWHTKYKLIPPDVHCRNAS